MVDSVNGEVALNAWRSGLSGVTFDQPVTPTPPKARNRHQGSDVGCIPLIEALSGGGVDVSANHHEVTIALLFDLGPAHSEYSSRALPARIRSDADMASSLSSDPAL